MAIQFRNKAIEAEYRQAMQRAKEKDDATRQLVQSWAENNQAQAIQYRPETVDERAFGVAREPISVPSPWSAWNQTSQYRSRLPGGEWQGPLTQGQLIEQATKGFADFNQRYDDAAQNYREAARRETAMLDPYDPLSVQRAGTDAAAAERSAAQNEWYRVAQDALWKIGPEGRAKLEQLVKDDAAWKEANPFGGYRDNSLRNELEELYGKQLVENLTEYIRQVGNAEVMAQRKQEAHSLGKESGAAAAATVPARLISGIEGTAGMLEQKGERLFSGSRAPLDWNDPSQVGTNVTGAVREGATSELGPVGKFLANTAFSVADSAAAAALGPYGAPLLATAAANASMQEAKARGASDDQAIALGLISGVAEAVTEKVSIDHLFSLKNPDSVKDILMNGLKQAVPEMSEEAASSVINLLADEVIMGNQSRYQEMIRDGMTSGEALIELAKEVGLDSLAGALSGFVTGSGRSAGVYGMETVTGERQARRVADVSRVDTQEAAAEVPETPPLSREEQIVSAMTQGLWQPASGADTYVGGVAQEFRPVYDFGDVVVDKQTGKRYEVVQQRENGGVIALDADNKADGTYHSFAADRIMPYEAREASDFDYSAPLFLAKPEYKNTVEMVDSGQRGEYHGSWTGGLHAVQLLDENGNPDRKVFVERDAFYAPGDVPAGDFRSFVAPQRKAITTENQTVANPATVDEGTRPEAAVPVEQTAVQPVQEAAPAETAQRATIPKKAYVGSPALEKMGIKVDGTAFVFPDVSKLREAENQRYRAQTERSRFMEKMSVTQKETKFAEDLANGLFDLSDISPGSVRMGVVEQLADLNRKVNAFDADMISKQRAAVKDGIHQIVDKVFSQVVPNGTPQLKGPLRALTKTVMVERQTERVLKQLFGDKDGQWVYDELFRPIGKNRAEKERFKNTYRDRVRTFKDSEGNERKLTMGERSVAMHLMEGQAAAAEVQMLPEQQRSLVKEAAQAANDGETWEKVVERFELKDGSAKAAKLQGLVQAYADYMDTLSVMEDMDPVILENAVDTYKQIYAEFYDALNDFLVGHGYQPIGFIKGYAPHFQKESVQNGFLDLLNSLTSGKKDEKVDALPASIAGRTADFRPNKKWNPHLLSREGNKTDYDIEYGFNRYLDHASEIFYHMDDIMRIRGMENWFREAFSSDSVKSAISEARKALHKNFEGKVEFLLEKGVLKPSDTVNPETVGSMLDNYYAEQIARADANSLSAYSEFTTWLQEAANELAGKQSLADRGNEFLGGRVALNFFNRLRTSFATANIAGNIASMLNQTSQLPQIQADVGRYLEYAAADLVSGKLANEDFVNQSDYLTEKSGARPLDAEREDSSKFIDALFTPSGFIDLTISKLAVRGRYLQALAEGMDSEAAMQEADDYGRRVMGSRGVGDMPQAHRVKRPIWRIIHNFQLEASNTLDHLVTDMRSTFKSEVAAKGKGAATKKAVQRAAVFLISSAVMNGILDQIYGGTPAPFDLIGWMVEAIGAGEDKSVLELIKSWIRKREKDEPDEEDPFKWAQFFKSLGGNAMDDIPLLQNASAALGWTDESLPQASPRDFVKSLWDAGRAATDEELSGEDKLRRVAENFGNVAAQVVPGGRQIQKAIKGLDVMTQGGKFSGYGDEQRLQYIVDQDNPLKWAQAVFFGPNALSEAKQYYASGDAAISAKMTGELQRLDELHGIPFADTAAMVREFRAIDETYQGEEQSPARAQAKRDAVAEMDLDDYDKIRVFCRLQGKSGATEAKYRALADKGLSWAQISEAAGIYETAAKNEALSAVERARKLEAWMDEEGLNIGQRRVVSELFPGAAAKGDDRYDYLSDRLEAGVPDAVVLSALTTNQWEAYHDYVKPAKIPAVVYADALGFFNSEAAKADKDKSGKSITGSKQKKVKRYIKTLRLTDKQKIALWEALGYKASSWAT